MRQGFRTKTAYLLLGINILLNTLISLVILVPILIGIFNCRNPYIALGIPVLLPLGMTVLASTALLIGILKFFYINNTRKLLNKEEEYLNSIVNEILLIINSEKDLELKIEQFEFEIIKTRGLEAFAYGKNTICVSEGFLYDENISEDELKAVLMHEFSHILNKDAIFLMCMLVSNLFMKGIGSVGSFWIKGIGKRSEYSRERNNTFVLDIIILIIYFIFVKLLSDTILTLLLRVHDRKIEYQCDEFVAELGYRDSLISVFNKFLALERLYGISTSNSLVQILYSTHPKTEDRIRKLEEYEKEEKQEIGYI